MEKDLEIQNIVYLRDTEVLTFEESNRLFLQVTREKTAQALDIS